jgi:RNA polymerase sigma-70 factor, ECF subfamily
LGTRELAGAHQALKPIVMKTTSTDRLTEIYDEFHTPIYRYIYRQVNDVETARDLTSEVFQNLIHSTRNGSGPTQHLSGWLYRTARNLVIDHYRRQQHRNHQPLDEEMAHPSSSPSMDADRKMTATQLRSALMELTSDQREVIILKFMEGKTNQEVAEIMQKPHGAIKSLQHRALAAMQKLLSASEESTYEK